ncbi:hypothetical protein O181_088180 [Austropuccinia psidii MF-1]|uniref:Tf2-1-like SH3-like domain-containing protein n=1 Tax=Austropuccinia psidii MF-1 TaxID=1389203 RepID=A0A9Q3P3F0_9BASI|nr:hypothetical protein [Austropuccinia psidii MF-1]
MMKIEEPGRPWENVHMDWVTVLPPGGDRSYNACLLIVDRFSKNPLFLPCHKDDTAMDTDLLMWNRVVTGIRIETSIHASANQTPAILEKGWNPKLPQYSLRKDLIEIHSTAASFKGMLDKVRKLEVRCIEDSFAYAKDKWDKSHATPDFKVEDLVLLSTTNLNSIKGCKKLKDSFSGPFVIKALHGKNAVEVELSEELSNKLPKFSVSLINPYKSNDAKKFPLRNNVQQVLPAIESSGIKKITKVLKGRKMRANKVREYLVRYSYPTCEDEWFPEKDIPEATKLLRRFNHTRKNNITK